MKSIKDVCRYLKKHDDYLILMHASPDGDTLGSGAALCIALQRKGKRAKLKCGDDIPERYNYIFGDVQKQEFEPKTIVAVDIADPKLLGSIQDEYGDKVDLCIDHHGSNVIYAKHSFIDATAAANCEVIYGIILGLGIKIDSVLANALYTGIATDTGCFKFTNTTGTTHRIAAALIEAEAAYGEINRVMFDTKSRGRIEVERQALENIEFFSDNRIAIMLITTEMQNIASQFDLEGITSLPRQIQGVVIGITMRQKPDNKFKISVRTLEGVNAAEICRRFDGGGHAAAAGCEVSGTYEEVRDAMISVCEKILDKTE